MINIHAKDVILTRFDEFVQTAELEYQITFTNNTTIVTKGKFLTFLCLYWNILTKYNHTIDPERHFVEVFYTKKSNSKMATIVYTDLYSSYANNSIVLGQITQDIYSIIGFLNNKIFSECQVYHRTLDIISISETVKNMPELQALINTDMTPYEISITALEAKYKEIYEQVYELMLDSKYKDVNAFHAFTKTGIFSKSQLPQVLVAGGIRTDIDETTMPFAIRTSFLEGFHTPGEFALDSLSAKKSKHYNAYGMRKTQYTNRSQQILAASILTIKSGDCGTPHTVPVLITPSFSKDVIGKNIVHNGKLIELTHSNIDDFINKTVNMRTVLLCRHSNHACEACIGGMARYIPKNTLLGILAGNEMMGPVGQLVLSNKHSSVTNTALFSLYGALLNYFSTTENQILFKDHSFTNKYLLGFVPEDVMRLNDLSWVDEDERKGSYFTKLTSLSIKDKDSDKVVVDKVPLDFIANNHLYLSTELLTYIFNYGDKVLIKQSDMVWLDTSKFSSRKPIISCPAINESTIEFSKRVKRLFASKLIRSHTSVSSALNACIDTIYERAHPNMVHVEFLLRACMITSGGNYDIPVVNNPDAVMFAELNSIISRRSIGAQLAFEQWKRYISDPRTYLFTKGLTFFDNFIESPSRLKQ